MLVWKSQILLEIRLGSLNEQHPPEKENLVRHMCKGGGLELLLDLYAAKSEKIGKSNALC